MSALADAQAPVRRAALALHSVSELDRAWMLGAISQEQRGQLEPLLQELEGLGIPREPAVLHEMVAAAMRMEPALETLELARGLEPEDLGRIAAALKAESPALVAAILGAPGWPWREEILARFDDEFRAAVRRALFVRKSAPALEQAIAGELRRVLPEHSKHLPAATPSRWQRLRARLQAARSRP